MHQLWIMEPTWVAASQSSPLSERLPPSCILTRSVEVAQFVCAKDHGDCVVPCASDGSLDLPRVLNVLQEHPQNPVSVINLLGWKNPDASYIPIDARDLAKEAHLYFQLFKAFSETNRPIDFTSVHTFTDPQRGFVEGMALSFAQEHTGFRLSSIHAPSLYGWDFQSKQSSATRTRILDGHPLVLDFQPLKGELWGESQLSVESFLKRGKTYVITGTGGIARKLALHLKQTYGATIVFFGRKDLDPMVLQDLQKTGADLYLKTDLSDVKSLQQAWAYCLNSFKKIHGVFHLAGVLRDGLFPTKSFETFQEVIAPKVYGTWNLDEVSANTPLDFFVNFGSLSGLVGNIGQTDYEAANGFM
jgi:hypothetical protein